MTLTRKIKNKLDKLASKFVLSRDGYTCQWCGNTSGRMNCSHCIPREFTNLRWAPSNLTTLCVSCHKFSKTAWHKSPLHAYKWFQSQYGEDHINKLLEASKIQVVWTEKDVLELEKMLNLTGQ